MSRHVREARARRPITGLVIAASLFAVALPSRAFEFLDGRIQVHGYVEAQLRTISDGFRSQRFYASQWANLLALEIEVDLAPEGFGPFASATGFARGEVRFECIWSQACGLSPSTTLFGNRANRQPQNLSNGVTSGYSGVIRTGDSRRIQNTNGNLVEFYRAPPLDGLADLGANNLEGTFAPVLDAMITTKRLEGSLFLRLGKQQIVWGKTELFRTTDQLNPQDLALSSLPSLEESRIALWAARAIYSLYDVGPLEDFRIEVAANLDGYQPIDLGKCGEPYTIFLVCAKSYGLFGHGILGLGIAGEKRPQNWWENVSGLEIGARIEFR